jgi:hypothetical protein
VAALEDVYQRTNFDRLPFAGDDPWLRFFLDDVFLHSIVKNEYFEATGQPIVQGAN